ncbi:MAG: ExeM/NucH family extracellular endonuclease, partial [Nocardioides sp.]
AVARNATSGDTDNNGADFAVGAPTPENSAAQEPPPPPTIVDKTIAEIQGTGTASPFAGSSDLYRTRGVVTASYPTGGFDGFYMQTEGTGLDADATPGASDGIFVWRGSGGTFTYPAVGDFVEVVGMVTEGGGPAQDLTELVPGAGGSVTTLADAHDTVTELQTNYPTTTAEREAHEGELLDVGAQRFTVTNTFPTNRFAEIGLATGNSPLIQPTDVARPGTPDAAAVEADNARRAVSLDDGASVDYTGSASDEPLPWLSKMNPIRVGAAADVRQPLILDYRNGTWKFQPTSRVTGDGDAVARFDNTRTRAPEAVGGDLRIATFNVLNYFNTTGEQFVADGGTCTYFNDRSGEEPVTNNTCNPNGPRGAADAEDLQRQQDKIVAAINGLGADVVSLEEIENSVKLLSATDKGDRDDAVKALVAALNAAQGSARWAYVPSPATTELPSLAEQDVIRSAFIYNPAKVSRVGASRVLTGNAAFSNAREPLAQAFKAKGVPNTTFAVIVNHFKSKSCPGTGDNADALDGQGCFNGDRTRQADALVGFANGFAASRGTDRVFLTGDFNSYTQEDPMHRLYDAGYDVVESDTPGESSYSFSGLSGSLDHVLASPAAMDMVSGADIWEINANESLAFEYSRHNYNVTDFYQSNVFRASDHNPEIVGINLPAADPGLAELNLLGINDFHGRINSNTVKFAGTVEQLTDEGGEANTLLVGAGDLIGASEFPSAIAEDQPTIDVMNALGLDASAVGNHEFDKGWVDLRDRVIGSGDNRNALWDYLGANVYAEGTTDPVLPEYALFEVDSVTVGVVGAVTEETASLVSPNGITEIDFGNPAEAVNRVAGELSDGEAANGEAEVIVASFHAGARQGAGSNYEAEVAKGGEFAEMATLDPAVDAIFNGHTHQVYAWDAPVPGEPTRTRPIVQTGEYGANVGQVKLTVDRATGDVQSYSVRNVARTTQSDSDLVATYPRVGDVKQIVDAALANAAEIGNVPVGKITGDITRAFVGGSYGPGGYVATRGSGTEDRSAESTMGGLVGNALRDGLPADMGTPDLGLVNPGGLREDLVFAGNTASNPENTDGVVTYAEANNVLPFVNNIWLVQLTGAQLKSVLEQQWQPSGADRPYLHLGLSDNVRVTQKPSNPAGKRITSVLINGVKTQPKKTYTVSTFSFLAAGGDNFHTLK